MGKQQILAWYRKRKAILDARRLRPVKVKMEVIVVDVDRETKEVVRKAKQPKVLEIERHRLAEQDYLIYLGFLEDKFKQYKREHNKKVRDAKRKKEND